MEGTGLERRIMNSVLGILKFEVIRLPSRNVEKVSVQRRLKVREEDQSGNINLELGLHLDNILGSVMSL